ncbi:MAG: hypothetical protein A2511_02040 [Deltaproteobacteria bacterium RIFOXYD12_FULL_50_9]|nr:MAG: hypothetical protein A2511_02040 [Deltaproteobacteria bacterium RIFOXYD12_FULL_50_9]
MKQQIFTKILSIIQPIGLLFFTALLTSCGGGGGGGGGGGSVNDVIIDAIVSSTRQNKLNISWEYDTSAVPNLQGFRVYKGTAKVCDIEYIAASPPQLQHQMTCDIAPFLETATLKYTMTAYDTNGNESAKSAPMTANKSPIAKIVATGKNRSAHLDASSSTDNGTITGYFWTFSDTATTASTAIVDHDFITAGLCTVTLTLTDNAGAQTSVQVSLNIP